MFYKDVLGLKPLAKWPQGAYFLAGDLWFCLSVDANRRALPSSDYTHVAFSISQHDFEEMVGRLKRVGVVSFKENKSEGDSFYFLDPDGHKLELHVGDFRTRLAARKDDPYVVIF